LGAAQVGQRRRKKFLHHPLDEWLVLRLTDVLITHREEAEEEAEEEEEKEEAEEEEEEEEKEEAEEEEEEGGKKTMRTRTRTEEQDEERKENVWCMVAGGTSHFRTPCQLEAKPASTTSKMIPCSCVGVLTCPGAA
jgi:hypothetical protein